jgi:MFS superfamily sulfate permease-like transporter
MWGLAAVYPVLTLLVVMVTANHFWLDGIAAGLLVALVLVVQRTARRLRSGKSCEGPQVEPVRGELSMRS